MKKERCPLCIELFKPVEKQSLFQTPVCKECFDAERAASAALMKPGRGGEQTGVIGTGFPISMNQQ